MEKNQIYKDRLHGFLHNHPGAEKELGLDKDHVIVDRKDWEEYHQNKPRIGIVGGSVDDTSNTSYDPEPYRDTTIKDIEFIGRVMVEETSIEQQKEAYKARYAQRHTRRGKW